MTANNEKNNNEMNEGSLSKSRKRRKLLSIFFSITFIIAILVTIYWYLFLKDKESTDDAYTNGNQVMISTQISGRIASVDVVNTDYVKAGTLLFSLENSDEKLALERAESVLASAVRDINQLNYQRKQLDSLVKVKEVALSQAQDDLQRREKIRLSGGISQEALQHSVDAEKIALNDYNATKEQLASVQALLLDEPVAEQPTVKQAITAVRTAWINLQRTKIYAPVDGYVARRSAQVGGLATPGIPLLAVIPTKEIWVDANYKETQLGDMRIGQPATVHFDMYGSDVTFNGRVMGIEAGTGSAFSLLPAQNATGNWIKVVQRVPVRIALEQKQIDKYPLLIGLSATVEINTANKEGKSIVKTEREQPQPRIALPYNEAEINKAIANIIQQNNLPPNN